MGDGSVKDEVIDSDGRAAEWGDTAQSTSADIDNGAHNAMQHSDHGSSSSQLMGRRGRVGRADDALGKRSCG